MLSTFNFPYLQIEALGRELSTLKVGIIGPESTGKSTLAQSLAEQFHGIYIEEYARTYVEKLGRPYTYEDVEAIARHQIEELASLSANRSPLTANRSQLTANRYFYDTELIVTKVWFEVKYGSCPKWLEEAIARYPMDFYILCYPDIEWKPDPVRENPAIRKELFARYLEEVKKTGVPYYIYYHD